MIIQFSGEAQNTNKKSVTIMISVDGKDTVFPVKFKSEGESFQ